MKLMIVDDSNIIRSRIARIALHPRLPDITIVGLAKNGREAVELSRRTPPDVVTMDLTMPEMDGIACIAALMAEKPGLNILVVSNYFEQLTSEAAVIRSSYLADAELPHFDYTGLITLAGRFRGCVYFSAPRLLMRELLLQMQEPDTCEQNLLDAVGEVANTISGNARRHFGSGLDISVPIAIKGTTAQIKSAVRARPFAILLTWQKHEAVVVVDLEPVD